MKKLKKSREKKADKKILIRRGRLKTEKNGINKINGLKSNR